MIARAATARLRSAAGSHPTAVDVAFAVAVYLALTLGITSQAEIERAHGAVTGALINVVLVGPLALRRRAPTQVLGVIVAAGAANAMTFGPTGGEAAAVVALGTAAASWGDGRRLAIVAAGVAATFAVVAALRGPEDLAQAIGVGLAALVAAVAVGVAHRARVERVAALADRAERLARERAQQAELALAAERAAIARELHDVVAHNVAVMIALADGAEQVADADPRAAREAVGQIAATGREALGELRGLLGVLRDSEGNGAGRSPQPSLGDLDDLVARMRAAGLPATLRVTGSPAPASPHLQMTIYRIAQEALTNALRHRDGTTQVQVQLRWSPQAVELEILDDGKPALSRPGPVGRGIAGMRERAATHGAELSAGAVGRRGWRVRTRIPLSDADEPATS